MQKQFVLPSKRRVDVVSVEADFSQELPAGDTIESGSVAVYVFAGEDPEPELMLDGNSIVSPRNIRQRVKLGLPGVVYQIVFTAVTVGGYTIEIECRQAVLRDEMPVEPVYTQYYFTTTPYPLETSESFLSAFDMAGAQYIEVPIDRILSAFSISSGNLRDIVRSYRGLPEGIDAGGFDILSGDLHQIVKYYTIAPEGVRSEFNFVRGDLYARLIVYTNWRPEGINSAFNIVSGSLV